MALSERQVARDEFIREQRQLNRFHDRSIVETEFLHRWELRAQVHVAIESFRAGRSPCPDFSLHRTLHSDAVRREYAA